MAAANIATACMLSSVAFLASAGLTWFAIRYARRNWLIDQPGQRRSHVVPTPRGGGIGIAVCAILAALRLAEWSPPGTTTLTPTLTLTFAIALVAAIGWIDDHRGLDAKLRLAVQFLTAFAVLAAPMMSRGYASTHSDITHVALIWLAGMVAVVWSINLHNFMDGIDGLLAFQALFVFTTLGVLFGHAGHPAQAAYMAICTAAVLAFLPFNFPHAHIFMGDVGSGVLGLLIAVAVLWQISMPAISPYTGVVACSAFVTDSTCTLLSRMLRGRRWYSAHREHLYQWLVRCGHSHAKVVVYYMGWNVVIVLPVVYWMNRGAPEARGAQSDLIATIAVYALAVFVWWTAKRGCLRLVGARRVHGAA